VILSYFQICRRVSIIVSNVKVVPIYSLDYYIAKKGLVFKYMYFPILSLPIASDSLGDIKDVMQIIDDLFHGLAQGPFTMTCKPNADSKTGVPITSLDRFTSRNVNDLSETYR